MSKVGEGLSVAILCLLQFLVLKMIPSQNCDRNLDIYWVKAKFKQELVPLRNPASKRSLLEGFILYPSRECIKLSHRRKCTADWTVLSDEGYHVHKGQGLYICYGSRFGERCSCLWRKTNLEKRQHDAGRHDSRAEDARLFLGPQSL